MKKLLFTALFIAAVTFTSNAQEMNVGFGAGWGYDSDVHTYIDWNYLLDVNNSLKLGVGVGLSHTSGVNSEVGFNNTILEPGIDAFLLPVSLNSRLGITKNFNFGLDFGYAFSLRNNIDLGGFYLAPRFDYDFSKKISIVLSARSISLHSSNIFNEFQPDERAYISNYCIGFEIKL